MLAEFLRVHFFGKKVKVLHWKPCKTFTFLVEISGIEPLTS